MRLRSAFALAFICFAGHPAIAEQSWLLTHVPPYLYALEVADERGSRKLAKVGGNPTFGISRDSLALLSRSTASNSNVLDLFDRKTQQHVASWPVTGMYLTELAGPANGIYLNDDAAYFGTIHSGDASQLNELGGWFNFNRVNRADGRQTTYPLPERTGTPRVSDYDGVPIVHAWNSIEVWKFDVKHDKLVQLVRPEDVEDILSAEREAERTGKLREQTFAHSLPVPGKGVYRLSKLGQLQQILRADLTVVPTPRPTLDLGDGPFFRIVAVPGKSGVTIGVIRQNSKRGITVQYVDPDSLKLTSEITVPDSTIMTSLVLTGSHDVYFIDPVRAAIRKTSSSGTTTAHPVPPADANRTVLVWEDDSGP